MDRGHHRPRFHHTLAKINHFGPYKRQNTSPFNHLPPDMDKGLIVFLSLLLLPSPTFKDISCEDLLTYLKSLMKIGRKYNDSIIFHNTVYHWIMKETWC